MSTIKEKFLNLEVMKNCVMFARMSNEEIFNGLKQLQLNDKGKELISNDNFEKISNTLNHIKFNFITFVFLPEKLNDGDDADNDQYNNVVISMTSFLVLLDDSIFGYEFNNVIIYCESINFETNDLTKFILFKFYDEIIVPIVDNFGYTAEMPVLFDKTMDSLEYLKNCNTNILIDNIKIEITNNNIDIDIDRCIKYIDNFGMVLYISYCIVCSEFSYLIESKVNYLNYVIAINGFILDRLREQNDTKTAVLLEACISINSLIQQSKDYEVFSLRTITIMGIFEEVIEWYDKYLHSINKRRNKKRTIKKSEEKSLEHTIQVVRSFSDYIPKNNPNTTKRNHDIF